MRLRKIPIKQTQALFTYLGYDPGAVDGVDDIPGSKTKQALREAVYADWF